MSGEAVPAHKSGEHRAERGLVDRGRLGDEALDVALEVGLLREDGC